MWWGGGVRIVKVLKWCEKVLYSVSFREKFVYLAGSRKGDRHVIWNWNPPSRLDVHDLLLHWYLHIIVFPVSEYLVFALDFPISMWSVWCDFFWVKKDSTSRWSDFVLRTRLNPEVGYRSRAFWTQKVNTLSCLLFEIKVPQCLVGDESQWLYVYIIYYIHVFM